MPANKRPWLIYALGGGWGHLMRSLALVRQLPKQDPIHILCNSPYQRVIYTSPFWQQEFQPRDLKIHTCPPHFSLDQVQAWVGKALGQEDLRGMIVDTFPRGLIGELADEFELSPKLRSLPKIWIHRDLDPVYIQAYEIRSFVRRHYSQILIPSQQEPLPLSDLGSRTLPWLIYNPEDLPDQDQMRAGMGVSDLHTHLIVICASGPTSELPVYGQLTQALAQTWPHVAVRCLSAALPPNCPPQLWIQHWPGMACLRGADLVLGGGGYHTVYECQALGVPLIAWAWRRRYDRQSLRLQSIQQLPNASPVLPITTIPAALGAVQSYLDQPRRPLPLPRYQNGAIQAAQIIVSWESAL